MAVIECSHHGMTGVYIYSDALLRLREDGSCPDLVTVEIKDAPEHEAFFRFNVTEEESKSLPIREGRMPFDMEAFDVMERLTEGCGRCFEEKRLALVTECPGRSQ